MTATTKTPKLTVWAPKVPGLPASLVATCDTMEQAEAVCARYECRADLRYHDVFVRLGEDGKIVARRGPAR